MSEHGKATKEQSPLSGVVLCCTSIPQEQRAEMAAVAQQMGAIHKLDLTSDVTHLIVGSIDTAKYRYVAKERQDIKVLQPEWLEAVRTSWLTGGDTDVASLEDQFTLPTFAGLHICVTGFEDLQQRNKIADDVVTKGAQYHGDLTKMVTHLVAAAPQGKKYEYARHWGLKIVTKDWLIDSMRRGMALEESLYDPLLPVDQRGRGAVTFKDQVLPVLRKRNRDPDQPPEDVSRRKLRRTTSQKLESQSDSLWDDIGHGDHATAEHQTADWEEKTTHVQTNSASRYTENEQAVLEISNQPASAAKAEEGVNPTSEDGLAGVFRTGPAQGERIHMYGFDERKTAILQDYLVMHGAALLSREDMEARFTEPSDCGAVEAKLPISDIKRAIIVVPHNLSAKELKSLTSQRYIAGNDRYATDWWVERCLHYKKLVDTEFVLSRPLTDVSIEGFKKLIICPTSFSGIDLLHLSKVVKLMGATYDESLRPNTSVLIANDKSPNQEKLRYAQDHNIEVVTADWLWRCVESKELQPFRDFRLKGRNLPKQIPLELSQKNYTDGSRSRKHEAADATTTKPIASNPANQRTSSSQGKQNSTCQPVGNPIEINSSSQSEDLVKPLRESLSEMNSPKIPTRAPTQHSESPVSGEGEVPLYESLDAKEDFVPGASTSIEPPANAVGNTSGSVPPEASVQSEQNSLDSAIAALLARKKAATSLSKPTSEFAGVNSAAPQQRRRPLGRAPSNPSSLGAPSLSRDGSIDTSLSAPQPMYEEEDEIPNRKRKLVESLSFRPSQALSYEDPEARAAREKLMKRMGLEGALEGEEGMTRVESVGLVKDSVGYGREDRAGRRRGGRRK